MPSTTGLTISHALCENSPDFVGMSTYIFVMGYDRARKLGGCLLLNMNLNNVIKKLKYITLYCSKSIEIMINMTNVIIKSYIQSVVSSLSKVPFFIFLSQGSFQEKLNTLSSIFLGHLPNASHLPVILSARVRFVFLPLLALSLVKLCVNLILWNYH